MEDTETIEGYEVKSSVRIGHKRLIFAVHPDEEEQYPYLKCTAIPDGIVVRYENAVASTDCLEALQLFADDIKAECASLEAQRSSCGLEDTSCLTNDELIPVSWEDNITGKVVAVKEHSLPEAHRDITHQLYYLNSGSVSRPVRADVPATAGTCSRANPSASSVPTWRASSPMK